VKAPSGEALEDHDENGRVILCDARLFEERIDVEESRREPGRVDIGFADVEVVLSDAHAELKIRAEPEIVPCTHGCTHVPLVLPQAMVQRNILNGFDLCHARPTESRADTDADANSTRSVLVPSRVERDTVRKLSAPRLAACLRACNGNR